MIADELRRQADQFIELRDLLSNISREDDTEEEIAYDNESDDYEYDEVD